jgi:ABC-2 type transport system permease protein
MSNAVYLRYELFRNFRSWRFFLLSLAIPLALYLSVAGSQRHVVFDGTAFPVYFMTAMATLGTMAAVLSSGARIAAERTVGWTRQLRTTPLTTSAYFTAKVLCGYLLAVLSISLLCLSGGALGVRLSAGGWATVVGLLLVGLIPFAVLGILLGHLLTADSLAPAVGATTSLFALLGGVYGFQLATSGPLFDIIKALPSYWLVQAGKTAVGGGAWPLLGWLVIAAWTAVLTPIAVLVYRRDTSRV